jgi:hypothetical protein
MSIKDNFSEMKRLLSILTDWFLILAGGVLVYKALVGVDVPVARYAIILLGVLLSGLGLWYRHRRIQQCR